METEHEKNGIRKSRIREKMIYKTEYAKYNTKNRIYKNRMRQNINIKNYMRVYERG